jgi:hypothetical protein
MGGDINVVGLGWEEARAWGASCAVPLSWIRGSAVWIPSSSSTLTLPSLIARILPLRASLGSPFPRNILSLLLSLSLSLPLGRSLPATSTSVATTLPPSPVAAPPFAHQNPRSSASCHRLSIHLPFQLQASIPSSFLFLSFQGVGT